MVKCLDTLIEFVQGPCKMNQETIIDSKFFQFAEDILDGYDEKKQQKKKMQSINSSSFLSSGTMMNGGDLKSKGTIGSGGAGSSGGGSLATSSAAAGIRKAKSMFIEMAQRSSSLLKPWMVEQVKYKVMRERFLN